MVLYTWSLVFSCIYSVSHHRLPFCVNYVAPTSGLKCARKSSHLEQFPPLGGFFKCHSAVRNCRFDLTIAAVSSHQQATHIIASSAACPRRSVFQFRMSGRGYSSTSWTPAEASYSLFPAAPLLQTLKRCCACAAAGDNSSSFSSYVAILSLLLALFTTILSISQEAASSCSVCLLFAYQKLTISTNDNGQISEQPLVSASVFEHSTQAGSAVVAS